ncbi:MAG: hypothetical protein AAB840_02835, partial [Patescibacteria group bacterium]
MYLAEGGHKKVDIKPEVRAALSLLQRDGCRAEFVYDRMTLWAPISKTYKIKTTIYWKDLSDADRRVLVSHGWTESLYSGF